jgi:hypothetical protein
VKCDHPSVTEGSWPAEALAITEAGRAALVKHRAELAEKKSLRRSGLKSDDDRRVVFRRDGERYIVFLGDDKRSPREISQSERIGFVIRARVMGLGTTSIRRWHAPATRRLEREPVSYCAVASNGWFAKVRSERYVSKR